MMMALLTTMPASRIVPSMEFRLKVDLNRYRLKTTPMNPRGTVTRITMGIRRELNWKARSR